MKTCKRGHLYKPSKGCPTCGAESKRLYVLNNPEKCLASKAKWRMKHHKPRVVIFGDGAAGASKRFYERNKARICEYYKSRYPERKGMVSRWGQEWRERNPDKNREKAARYYASKRLRTPRWLTAEQRSEIRNIHKLARELSWLSDGGLHVDHVFPLKGEIVSGLNVPWNLQIVPATENISRGNRVLEVPNRVL